MASGALYLSYPEGTYAFYVSDTLVSPNSTATWIDNGADISNVFDAMRKDMVKIWGEKRTFQFAHYNVTKVTKGIAKHAATFWFQAQTPSFVQGLRHPLRWRLPPAVHHLHLDDMVLAWCTARAIGFSGAGECTLN